MAENGESVARFPTWSGASAPLPREEHARLTASSAALCSSAVCSGPASRSTSTCTVASTDPLQVLRGCLWAKRKGASCVTNTVVDGVVEQPRDLEALAAVDVLDQAPFFDSKLDHVSVCIRERVALRLFACRSLPNRCILVTKWSNYLDRGDALGITESYAMPFEMLHDMHD